MKLTELQSKTIEDNRKTKHNTKRTCKVFVKILKDYRGEENKQCFCGQFERDSYCTYFYNEWHKINNTDDSGETI